MFKNTYSCKNIFLKTNLHSFLSKVRKNYAFFFGPDPQEVSDLYPYPFNDPYYPYELPILDPYTEFFKITQVEEVRLENITKATTVHTRMIK